MGKKTDTAATLRSGPTYEQQCLRILRCTAHALANSPGGLRFKAGTQPWLEALPSKRGQLALSAHRKG